jgi:hypothetical protein
LKRWREPKQAKVKPSTVNRGRRTIDGWAILPAATRLEHVNDAADHPPIVGSASPGWFLGRSGSIVAHCASLNQNSPAIIQAPNPESA